MTTPVWLRKQAVLAFHAECIRAFGGSDGVRDEGLLESALARPLHLHTLVVAACGGRIAPNSGAAYVLR